MATYIDNIVKFHTFSKSPVSKDTTLGGAVNPSGHTVTTSQVRAQDIPAFLNTFQGTKEQAITWLGTNYPTPAHNDIVFYGGEFKAGFSTPKCLKWNAKLETPAWEDFNITTAATLKNADDKDVIAVHQNCTTVFVDGSNNAATNSNRNSLFVKRADGSILDHFVASTDKIVAGMPSLGYNALVLWNGGAIDEGELDANYIGNTFAGIVHLNKQYSTGDDAKFKVTCFEYIGDKLDTALGDIDGKIQDIVGTTMEGVVASVGTTTAATNAGISVDSTTKTSPKIDITTGTVGGNSDAKLVTGSTVKSYVDNATSKATVSADGVVTTGDEAKLVTATSAQYIAKKAASNEIAAATLADGQKIATTTDTTKLVTVEDVTTYVSENAKVTLTQGTGITVSPNGEASTSFTVAVDDTVATKKSVDDLSDLVSGLPATIRAAQDAADDAMEEAQKKVASITTDTVPEGVTITTGTTPQLSIVTAQEGAAVDRNKLVTKGTAEAIASGYATNAANTIKGQTLAQTGTLSGMFTVQTAGTVGTGITGITITDAGLSNAISSAKKAGTDAAAAVETLKTTSVNYSTSLGVDADTVTVALGGKVGTPSIQITNVAAASALTALENKVNAYHEAGVSYKIHDSQTLPDLSVAENVEKYKNVILLVPDYDTTGNNQDTTAAMSGSYVEWLCVNKGTKEAPSWAWEQIGTTEADLSDYARGIIVNNNTYAVASQTGYINLGSFAKTVATGQANTLSNQSSVYGFIAEDGTLTLGIASATDSVMGVSKMFIGDLSPTNDSTATDTAVSVKSAQEMYSSLAALANSKVSVKGNAYLNLAGLAVYTSYDYNNVAVSSENIRSINDGTTVIESANIIGVKDCTLVDKSNNT